MKTYVARLKLWYRICESVSVSDHGCWSRSSTCANQGLQEYDAEWRLRYDEANQRAGLAVNNVAKSLSPQQHQDDLQRQQDPPAHEWEEPLAEGAEGDDQAEHAGRFETDDAPLDGKSTGKGVFGSGCFVCGSN